MQVHGKQLKCAKCMCPRVGHPSDAYTKIFIEQHFVQEKNCDRFSKDKYVASLTYLSIKRATLSLERICIVEVSPLFSHCS